MKTLKRDIKDQLREHIRAELESPLPTEAKMHLLHLWVCGLMENADEHEKVFFEDKSG